MRKQYDIALRDSVIDPQAPSDKVRYKDRKRPLYRVYLYLDGPDLPYVRAATYELHETFKNRFLRVERTMSNPMCKASIWTWGIFTVKAIVETKTGDTITLEHRLTYGDELQNEKLNFVRS